MLLSGLDSERCCLGLGASVSHRNPLAVRLALIVYNVLVVRSFIGRDNCMIRFLIWGISALEVTNLRLWSRTRADLVADEVVIERARTSFLQPLGLPRSTWDACFPRESVSILFTLEPRVLCRHQIWRFIIHTAWNFSTLSSNWLSGACSVPILLGAFRRPNVLLHIVWLMSILSLCLHESKRSLDLRWLWFNLWPFSNWLHLSDCPTFRSHLDDRCRSFQLWSGKWSLFLNQERRLWGWERQSALVRRVLLFQLERLKFRRSLLVKVHALFERREGG